MTPASFYAHGKLLLTGEYFVLAGAKALALPSRFGQRMEVLRGEETGVLQWESLDERGQRWLQARFTLPGLGLLSKAGSPLAERLQRILRQLTSLRGGGDWLSPNDALLLRTHLEFPRDWGLGSSSTLLSCLARWAEVDVYALSDATFGGSGYDLAAAVASGPFFFRRENGRVEVEDAPFDPPFRENLYFVHLGRKQDSRQGIRRFEARRATCDAGLLKEVSALGDAFSICRKAADFQQLMHQHEALVGRFLDLPLLQEERFADFSGAVKSLGAWGGDFALVCSPKSEQYVKTYFNQKGLEVLLPYEQLALYSPASGFRGRSPLKHP